MTLDELAKGTASWDAATFKRTYPEHALVFFVGHAQNAAPEGVKTTKFRRGDPLGDTGKFRTDVHTDFSPKTTMAKTHDDDGRPREFELSSESEVVFLKKTERNTFATMITLGRASNNDIWIPLTSVSKMHAYFVREGPRWKLTDQHSTNGTFVNGNAIRGEAATLDDGAFLDFGPDARVQFISSNALFELLKDFRPGTKIRG